MKCEFNESIRDIILERVCVSVCIEYNVNSNIMYDRAERGERGERIEVHLNSSLVDVEESRERK